MKWCRARLVGSRLVNAVLSVSLWLILHTGHTRELMIYAGRRDALQTYVFSRGSSPSSRSNDNAFYALS